MKNVIEIAAFKFEHFQFTVNYNVSQNS